MTHKLPSLLLALLLCLSLAACGASEPDPPTDPAVDAPTVLFSVKEERIEADGALLYLGSVNQPRLLMPAGSDPAIAEQVNALLSQSCAALLACPVEKDLLIGRYESDKAHFQPISRQITVQITGIGERFLSLLLRCETVGGGISAALETSGITLPLTASPAPLTFAEAFSLSEEEAHSLLRSAILADIAHQPQCYDLADPSDPPMDRVGFVLDGADGEHGAWIFLTDGIAPGIVAPMVSLSGNAIDGMRQAE